MNLTAALYNSLSGLRASQAGVDVVSRNVANAATPGYTRKTLPREAAVLQGDGRGVRTLAMEREIDLRVQRELRTERSANARLEVVDGFLKRVDDMFGRPEDEVSLAASVKRLTTGLQALADTPEPATARQAVVSAADGLAGDLNRASKTIQQMRLEADQGMAEDVEVINEALARIADLNGKIAGRHHTGQSAADLEDERDIFIDRDTRVKVVAPARDRDSCRVAVHPICFQILALGHEGRALIQAKPRTLDVANPNAAPGQQAQLQERECIPLSLRKHLPYQPWTQLVVVTEVHEGVVLRRRTLRFAVAAARHDESVMPIYAVVDPERTSDLHQLRIACTERPVGTYRCRPALHLGGTHSLGVDLRAAR